MVSVIIPVYNVEKYLSQCIDSVINQTYPDLEILLVDDGSRDNSGQICDEYAKRDTRIQVIHKKNEGVSAARNTGINSANGEWILFVDSDDWISRNLLEICLKYTTEETDICFFGYKEIEENGQAKTITDPVDNVQIIEKKDFLGCQFRIFNRDREACCNRNTIKLSSSWKLYRRSLIEQYDIRFPVGIRTGEDGVFNLYAYQYARSGICIDSTFYFYRRVPGSVTHRYTEKVEEDFRRLHAEYDTFIKKTHTENIFKELLQERLIWSFSFCCILKYCHPDNTQPYKVRRNQFLREYQQYAEVLQSVSFSNFGLRKKMIFYFIKKKCFLLVDLLCKAQSRLEK